MKDERQMQENMLSFSELEGNKCHVYTTDECRQCGNVQGSRHLISIL